MKLLEMKFSSKQQKSRRKQAYFDKIKNNLIGSFVSHTSWALSLSMAMQSLNQWVQTLHFWHLPSMVKTGRYVIGVDCQQHSKSAWEVDLMSASLKYGIRTYNTNHLFKNDKWFPSHIGFNDKWSDIATIARCFVEHPTCLKYQNVLAKY